MRVVPVLLLLGVLAPIAARAQGADDALRPDATTCKQTRTAPAAATDVAAPPVTWTDFEVQGSFSDNPATVRALLAPTMQRHRALTDTAREDVQEVAAAFGYYLVGLGTKATPDGTKAIVHLAPLPMVRNVEVDTSLSLSGRLDEEIRRRMRLRTGAYLPWSPSERTCELDAERRRLEEFLADEGYFDASVRIETRSKGTAVVLRGIEGKGAARLGERLRQAVCSEVVEHDGRKIQVTLSGGVASLADTSVPSADELVATADRRLYVSKQRGRNQVTSEG